MSWKGISYHLTVPHSPQQNSVAERMIRIIAEKKGRSAIAANKTPYELWHNNKPGLNYFRVFGSTVYIPDKTRKNKFD